MQEESPEGGRFKKEVVVDGQSFLLLIRDEGGPPEIQVSCVGFKVINWSSIMSRVTLLEIGDLRNNGRANIKWPINFFVLAHVVAAFISN